MLLCWSVCDYCVGLGFKLNDLFLFGSIKMDIKFVLVDFVGIVIVYYVGFYDFIYLKMFVFI